MGTCRQAHQPTAQTIPWLWSPAPSCHHPWLLNGGKAPQPGMRQDAKGLRTIPAAQFPPCLFYLQQAALSWFRLLTWRQVTCTWLTDVPRLVRNCGLQNICKTLCSSWGSSQSPAALEQLGAHQVTSGLQSKEALPAPGGELWPPSGHACRQLKGMIVLKAFLIIPHNTVTPQKASGKLWQDCCTHVRCRGALSFYSQEWFAPCSHISELFIDFMRTADFSLKHKYFQVLKDMHLKIKK